MIGQKSTYTCLYARWKLKHLMAPNGANSQVFLNLLKVLGLEKTLKTTAKLSFHCYIIKIRA